MSSYRHNDYGKRWQIASALVDGPLTIDEIREYFGVMGRRFGVLALVHGEQSDRFRSVLARNLEQMESDGWVVATPRGYTLTECGRGEAEKMLEDLRRSGAALRKLRTPQTVSVVTLITHFVLAALKLPAAVLSGSVGLLNDALDTLADGVSSLLVFFGVRSGRERLASIVLLGFMSATGVITAVEAIGRLLEGAVPRADPLAFLAVAISALVCAALWVYQRYVGAATGCVPLIAQSIDSRNHVIVAGSVAAGLVAAAFELPYVDGAVGLVVSALVFKGAAELLVEIIRSGGDEEVDLSAYGFTSLERSRGRSLARWLLLQLNEGNVENPEDLEAEAHRAVDYSHIASFRALGIADARDSERIAAEAVRILRDEGLVTENPTRITTAGTAELNRALKRGIPGHGGGPVVTVVRALAGTVASAVSLGVFALVAAGVRRALMLLPEATVLAGGTVVATFWGMELSALDLGLAAAGAAVHLSAKIATMLRRRKTPDGPHGRPVAARIADALALALATNSFWTLGLAAARIAGAALLPRRPDEGKRARRELRGRTHRRR